MTVLSKAVFDVVFAEDANVTASADQQLQQQEDEMSFVTEDDSTACKSDEPSVQCLAADLLSAWHSLKVFISALPSVYSLEGVFPGRLH